MVQPGQTLPAILTGAGPPKHLHGPWRHWPADSRRQGARAADAPRRGGSQLHWP